MASSAGASTWEYVGKSSAATSTSGNITLNMPAGVQEGDLLVATVAYRANAAFTSPGSPWEQVQVQNSGNTTANTTGSIASGVMFWCLRGASDPGLTFTRTSGNIAVGFILAYRNANPTGTLVASTSTTMASASTSVSVSGLTTQNPRDLIVFALCRARVSNADSFNATDPGTSSGTASNETGDPAEGDWQEREDYGTTSGADVGITLADAIRATAGATGNLTCTVGGSARHVVIAAAFKEA